MWAAYRCCEWSAQRPWLGSIFVLLEAFPKRRFHIRIGTVLRDSHHYAGCLVIVYAGYK